MISNKNKSLDPIRAKKTSHKKALLKWLTALNTSGISKYATSKIYTELAEKDNNSEVMLAAAYVSPFLTVKHFSESSPKEKNTLKFRLTLELVQVEWLEDFVPKAFVRLTPLMHRRQCCQSLNRRFI